MSEPEDESDPLTNRADPQLERDVHESLPARDIARIGSMVKALGARQSKFDAVTKLTQMGALTKLSTGAQMLALSDKVSALTNIGATSKLAWMLDETNRHSRHLQDMTSTARLLAQSGILAENSKLAALASAYPGSTLPNWAILQNHSNIGQLMHPQRWAEHFSAAPLGYVTDRASRFATGGLVSEQLRLLAERAAGIRGSAGIGALLVSPGVEAMLARNVRIGETLSKLSVFAGAIDTIGAFSPVSSAAAGSLLGEWQTRPDLPEEFWHRRSVRQRYYEEAEVDRGLIDTRNTEIVEVLVESGLVEGQVRGKRVTAVIEAGPLSVEVSASRTRIGTYRAITGFEIAMRGLVRRVLVQAQIDAGENPDAWFKQRVPGDILQRAKERKADAERAGEQVADLIAFVDLGDLIPIVTLKKNWPVFQPIFGNAEDFRVDMRRLNTIRRPAMHSRSIDPIQFTEMVIVINRISSMIRDSFGWMAEWDEET
ncbi:hypothetical protein IP65_17740 [Novosphingobium sp. AAP1]|uniref:hypothetical protein n=1 Tax=Novosphingobium sp. AAP1 TaxID=1523413 RepID=UPI0006B92CA0|nr:hypothetical protein [Novosphingobium sp. AAP1]KPF52038.1 hypothetical protein IP65_17740 [Novosphingobium sp. AAP1]